MIEKERAFRCYEVAVDDVKLELIGNSERCEPLVSVACNGKMFDSVSQRFRRVLVALRSS